MKFVSCNLVRVVRSRPAARRGRASTSYTECLEASDLLATPLARETTAWRARSSSAG